MRADRNIKVILNWSFLLATELASVSKYDDKQMFPVSQFY